MFTARAGNHDRNRDSGARAGRRPCAPYPGRRPSPPRASLLIKGAGRRSQPGRRDAAPGANYRAAARRQRHSRTSRSPARSPGSVAEVSGLDMSATGVCALVSAGGYARILRPPRAPMPADPQGLRFRPGRGPARGAVHGLGQCLRARPAETGRDAAGAWAGTSGVGTAAIQDGRGPPGARVCSRPRGKRRKMPGLRKSSGPSGRSIIGGRDFVAVMAEPDRGAAASTSSSTSSAATMWRATWRRWRLEGRPDPDRFPGGRKPGRSTCLPIMTRAADPQPARRCGRARSPTRAPSPGHYGSMSGLISKPARNSSR